MLTCFQGNMSGPIFSNKFMVNVVEADAKIVHLALLTVLSFTLKHKLFDKKYFKIIKKYTSVFHLSIKGVEKE